MTLAPKPCTRRSSVFASQASNSPIKIEPPWLKLTDVEIVSH